MSREIADRIEAAEAIRDTFSQLPNKSEAWQDLLRLIQDKDSNVRNIAMDALGCAFGQVPDRNEAWQKLVRLTKDKDNDEEYDAEISQENLNDRSLINAIYGIC